MTWIPWFISACLGFAGLVCVVAWMDERARADDLQRRLNERD